MLIYDLWEKNNVENPQKTAFIYKNEKIDYATAFGVINQYSNVIDELLGLEGNRIGILLKNSPEFLYSYFAIAQTGNIAIPINDMLKGNEVAYILNNSQCTILVTSNYFLPMILKVRSHLPALQKIIVVDTIIPGDVREKDLSLLNMKELLKDQPKYFFNKSGINSNRIMVFIYTSGTTGFPKPAMISHRNLLSNVKTAQKVYGLTGNDIFTCILPMWHNYSITDCCLLPIMLGATIIIGEQLNTTQLLELIETYGITFLATVPSQLIEMVNMQSLPSYNTSSLRMVQTGGCALPKEIQEKFQEQYGLPIIEGYGLSEASATVSVNPVKGPYKANSVGKIFPNQQVRIVDENENKLKSNEVGEITVKGPNIMSGYYGLPHETKQTLKDDWLYTGDLGCFDEDGYLYIKGRKKEMINVGGFNVYPKEVEAVIYSLEGVVETCVIKSSDPHMGEVVKALVVKDENTSLDTNKIRHQCKERLADYKVPSIIEFRQKLPKTGSGKIARHLLSKEEVI